MSIFYVIFILMTIYFSFRYDGIEEYVSKKQHRLWLVCGYLVLLTGFSYGLGGDKFTYMNEFEQYPNTLDETGDYIWLQFMLRGQMPLWTIVNLLSKVIFNSFYAVQLIESAAINISVCYLVSKYTHRYFLFLLIYFFSLQYFIFNTEIMREGFAMSFALIGMHGYISNKRWLFILMFPIALLFHVSAATMLLLPLARFKVTWKVLGIAFFTSLFIWVFSDLLLGRVMVSVLGGLGAMVAKVLYYSIQASTLFGFLRSIITYLIFPFIIMYTVVQAEEIEEIKKRKEAILAFMMILAVLASSFAGFTRLYSYCNIFYLIMLADFIYKLFASKEHLIIRTGTLAGTAFLIMLTYMIEYKTTNTYYYQFFYPYTCILKETDDVYIREVAHAEAVSIEEEDNNVRKID